MSDVILLTQSIIVKLDGRQLSAEQEQLLQFVSIEQTWSAADRIEMRFDEWDDLAVVVDVGAAIEASVADGNSTTVLFTGSVTAIGYHRDYSGNGSLVVEGYDDRQKLTRTIAPTTYENTKLSDVVADVAGRHGLQSSVPASLSTTTFPSWVAAASDFALLQQIALLFGAPWTLEDGTITFADPTAAGTEVTLTGDELFELDLRATPIEQSGDVEVHGWDPATKSPIVDTKPAPNSPHDAASELGTATPLDRQTIVSWRRNPRDATEAGDLASAIGRRLRNAQITGRGTTFGNGSLRPGVDLKLQEVSKRVNGKYRVSEVRHEYGNGSLLTHFRIGPDDAGFAELIAPDAWTANPVTRGVTIGVVTENDPASASSDDAKPGMVRVQLPFLGDSVQTGWARLMSLGAGKDRGIAFLPEIGDEVLVAFEHGDLNRPYVLGTVWNDSGSALTGTVRDNLTNERTIVSRLGNKIRFVDTGKDDAASGMVVEVDDAKTKLFLGYQETTLTTKDRPLKLVNGKASIVLENDEIKITANKVTISASSGDVTVDGQNIKVSGKANVELTANSQFTAKANATATVQSSGMTNIKGSTVKVN